MSHPRAIAYAGFPGAGKTEAARFGVEHVGGTHVSMGEVVKALAKAEIGTDATSEQIGEWATLRREFNGEDAMALLLVERWATSDVPVDPVHIEGVRSPEEIEVFRRFFPDLSVVFVDSDFEDRLSRIQARDRDGEGGFDGEDLIERDEREMDWGLLHLHEIADYHLPNDGDLSVLRNRVRMLTEGILGIDARL
jgi:dephospho-CoA kinase